MYRSVYDEDDRRAERPLSKYHSTRHPTSYYQGRLGLFRAFRPRLTSRTPPPRGFSVHVSEFGGTDVDQRGKRRVRINCLLLVEAMGVKSRRAGRGGHKARSDAADTSMKGFLGTTISCQLRFASFGSSTYYLVPGLSPPCTFPLLWAKGGGPSFLPFFARRWCSKHCPPYVVNRKCSRDCCPRRE